jgi:putative transposase
MKERLTRLERIYRDHPVYFLTFCTHNRQKILADPTLHSAFQTFSQAAIARHIFVGRYVIMPDHIHLFVSPTETEPLAMWMKSLKNSLSKTLKTLGHPAPHWQKGYFDHLVRSESAHDSKWIYVRMNPVRHGLVDDPDKWPYQGQVSPFS